MSEKTKWNIIRAITFIPAMICILGHVGFFLSLVVGIIFNTCSFVFEGQFVGFGQLETWARGIVIITITFPFLALLAQSKHKLHELNKKQPPPTAPPKPTRPPGK